MNDSAAPGRFRQGSGRLCLDFLRTLRHRGTPEVTERLTDPEALAAWVRQCGPCCDALTAGPAAGGPAGRSGAERPPGAGQLRDAQALREAVYVSVLAALGPEGPCAVGAEARRRLNDAAAAAVPTPRLTPSGELVWQSADPITATLALIARDALDLVTSPALLARVHHCASPTCGALFLDQSRPGTRRWCSMDTCGNRAKKAGLRARG